MGGGAFIRGDRRETGLVVSLWIVMWVLVVSGAVLVGAGLVAWLIARIRHRLREQARRGRSGALVLWVYLCLWLLAIGVWITVFALLLSPQR